MTANNIIRGPWVGNDPTEVVSPLATGVTLVKATHVLETLETLMPMLFNNIELCGFNWDEQGEHETRKDATLIVESVKSLLFKYHGLHHPLQTIAEGIFVEDEEYNVDFATHINADLMPCDSLKIGIEVAIDIDDALEE